MGLFACPSYAQGTENPLVRFSVKADKKIYEIGEEISILGFVKNLSSKVVYIQSKRPFVNTGLIIKSPSGKQFEAIDDRGPFLPTDYSAVLPGEEIEYFQFNLMPEHLLSEGNPSEASLEPLNEEGDYEISCLYQDANPVFKKALEGVFYAEPAKITLISLTEVGQKYEQKSGAQEQAPSKKTRLSAKSPQALKEELITPLSQEAAVLLATKYINNQKAYQKKKLTFLFISDEAENGFWVAGFEEERDKTFHAVKINAKTGETEETYFIE